MPKLNECELGWYCLRAQPKREHIAARILKAELGVEVSCPRLRYVKATRRGKIHWVEPLFPGYLFIHCPLSEMHRRILATPGITGILARGDWIPCISEDVIQAVVEQLAEAQQAADNPENDADDPVFITEGPFAGIEAVFRKSLPGRERVKVLLEILGQWVEVGLDSQAIRGRRFR